MLDGSMTTVAAHRDLTNRLHFPVLPAALVDALPRGWWSVGNLHFVPGSSRTWHFCAAAGADGVSVRTVEAAGRVIAWGRKPFDFDTGDDR